MVPKAIIEEYLTEAPRKMQSRTLFLALFFIVLGVIGLGVGLTRDSAELYVALYVNVVFLIGLAISGLVISALFQLTKAKWGRAYRRLAEGFLVFMPLGLGGILLLLLGAGSFVPWLQGHHLSGGKQIWLVRGFWDARILFALGVSYGLSLLFGYYSIRKDFCLEGVVENYSNRVASFFSRNITDGQAEQSRCERKMSLLAPVIGIVYAFTFTFLAIDLVMALDPEWFSTLFGAWYFFGNLFAGLAFLILVSHLVRESIKLERFVGTNHQMDLATLLFAFCLVHIDFFWSQYLTIWYGNLPEETHYLITRSMDLLLPWRHFSWVALLFFFVIPFVGLLFRWIKSSKSIMVLIAGLVFGGVWLARFIEIAPAFLDLDAGSGLGEVFPLFLLCILFLLGFIGLGLLFYGSFLTKIPALPIGDDLLQVEVIPVEEAK